MVQVNPGDDIGETAQTCGVAIGFDAPVVNLTIDSTNGLDYLKPNVSRIEFRGVEVVRAELVVWDIARAVVETHLTSFVFTENEALKNFAPTLYSGPGTLGTVWAGLGPAQYFNKALNTTIYDPSLYQFMLSFSAVADYVPISIKTGRNMTQDECRPGPDQLVEACSTPGLLDANYPSDTRQFLDYRLPAFPVFVAAGSVAADGMSAPAAADRLSWRTTDDMRSYGRCTSPTVCGPRTTFCPPVTGGILDASDEKCSECTATIDCLNIYSQDPSNARSTCLIQPRKAIGICIYQPMPAEEVVYVPQPPDQTCACDGQFCENNVCVNCRTGKDSDCELPWSPIYSAKCVSNACSFSLPSVPVKVKDNSKFIIAVAAGVAGGVLVIGLVIVGVCCYLRREKKLEADVMMGDQLAKKPKTKRFTFSE